MPTLVLKTSLFAAFFCAFLLAGCNTDKPDLNTEVAACAPPTATIASVQGDGPVSALQGQQVTVKGIVTLIRDGQGMFIEEPESDRDKRTSNALFIQAETLADEISVGALISTRGIVTEIDNGRYTVTALTDLVTLVSCSDGNPLPISTITLPLDGSGREALEGMRVQIDGELVANDVFQLSDGNFTLAGNGIQFVPTEVMTSGPEANAKSTQNRNYSLPVTLPDELEIDAVISSGSSIIDITGVLAHDGRGLRLSIQEISTGPETDFVLPPTAQAGELRVVGMNLHNYFNGDGRGSGFPTPRGAGTPAEYDQQRDRIAAGIQVLQPHILAVMELENDGFDRLSAASDFIQLANASSGSEWQVARPENDDTGSDKITVGLFYRTDILQALGPAQTLTGPEFRRSRQPIAQVFQQHSDGRRILVVVNHLKSKGSCPPVGENTKQHDGQGCWNPMRTASAVKMAAWATELAEQAGTANILIMGDMNAYRREDPINAIRNSGFIELMDDEIGQVYSYIFFGQAGTLDYAFASTALQRQVQQAFIWHANAIWPPNMQLPRPWMRFSDHDPVVVDIRLHQSATSD